MDFRYGDEHVELRQGVRRLLADIASEAATREAMASDRGWDPGVWKRLTQEIGAMSLAVPEEHGGAGFGLMELGLVLQEAGRSLVCAPLLSGSVAVQALLAAGAHEDLPDIAAGELLATLAHVPSDVVLTDSALTGTLEWVLDAQTADLLLIPADGTLFAVRSGDGVRVEPVPGVDPTRRQARVHLSAAPATALGAYDRGVLDVAVVLLAAEQLGVAEQCLESATAYAKEREQFGRAIGSFQAIKHKLADVLLEVEAATSAVMFALWTADRAPAELRAVAPITGATCSEAALLAAGESIQVHGGMGATWEHPAHLYLKRATTSRVLYGDPQSHLEAVASQIL
jgi:alkylation response protein AidB-like acyl-CoA dehydrogenase